MWYAMAVHLKIKQLKEKYPTVLGSAVFSVKGGETSEPMSPLDSLMPTTSSRSLSSGPYLESTSKASSWKSFDSVDEQVKGISSQMIVNLGSVLTTVLGNLNAVKGPITVALSWDILRTLIRSENLDDMLSFFMSQMLIRTGTTTI